MLSKSQCLGGQRVLSTAFLLTGPGTILRSFPDPDDAGVTIVVVRFDDGSQQELSSEKLRVYEPSGSGKTDDGR